MKLNITRSPGCSSIFQPNLDLLKEYPNPERFTVESEQIMEATSLDNLFNSRQLTNIDFLKADVQGAELEILRGGAICIPNNLVGIEVEVEFLELYKDQPLFSDVDKYIRDEFKYDRFDIQHCYWKYAGDRFSCPKKGQLAFGDALYLRRPSSYSTWLADFPQDKAKIKIQAAFLISIIYGYPEYFNKIVNLKICSRILSDTEIQQYKKKISAYAQSYSYQGRGSTRASQMFKKLYHIFQATHEDWASVGDRLGSQKSNGCFYA